MNQEPNIFPEDEITPEVKLAQRKIRSSRIMLGIMMMWDVIAILTKKPNYIITISSIIIYGILLLLSRVKASLAFTLAAVFTGVQLAYHIYLRWIMSTQYNKSPFTAAFIFYTFAMVVIAISFINGAKADRKIKASESNG